MRSLKLLKALNLITSIFVALLTFYVLLRPLIPELKFALHTTEFKGYATRSKKPSTRLEESGIQPSSASGENKLVIPKIYVDTPIKEGVDESILNLGMWRRPNTSTPNKGGNTVITGHRFLFTEGSDTFYFLDKVEINDEILVFWDGKEYVYKVFEILEVTPDRIDIEYNTKDAILTLYTCTPLWTSEKRLVVKAKLQ